MNSCVPNYLIQGNGTIYTNDFYYKNGGPQLGSCRMRRMDREEAGPRVGGWRTVDHAHRDGGGRLTG